MSQAAPKLFRRESGQMQAVTAEAQEILEAAKALVAKVKSDPPSAITNATPFLSPAAEKAKLLGLHQVIPRDDDDESNGPQR